MSALNSNNTFDGLDEPVRPTPGVENADWTKKITKNARGCSLWRSLLERPPPAPETRVRDLLGVMVRVGYINTRLVRPAYSMSVICCMFSFFFKDINQH